MKNILLLIIICFTFLFSCKDESTKANTKNPSSKIENLDCETFFKTGDYSSICFIDDKLPSHGGSGCIFDFKTKGNKQEEKLLLQFTHKNSAMLAEMHFDLNKSNYKKGTITNVSNLGDTAFFDVYGTDLKSLSISNKDLHVRYNNVVFVLMAEYMTSNKTPCFYSDKELIAFAEIIIKNL